MMQVRLDMVMHAQEVQGCLACKAWVPRLLLKLSGSTYVKHIRRDSMQV